jgi:L-iditol 2-dehydrogenase
VKAAYYYAPGDIRVEEAPIPDCPPGGALVKMIGNTICGTDVETYKNGYFMITPPQILGHECCGEIAEIDNKGLELKIGDRISIQPNISCGVCRYCQQGIFNLCEKMESMPCNYSGTFADYVAVPEKAVSAGNILKVPENVSNQEACLGEPLACVLNAQELLDIELDDTVLVIGAGPIGLLNAEIARIRGAKQIIIAENVQERIEKAKEFNYSGYINTGQEDLVEGVMGITDGIGADVVICTAVNRRVQERAVEALAYRGRLSLFAALPLEEPDISVSNRTIHYRELKIVGGVFCTNHQMKQGLDILSRGVIKSKKIITHTLPLEKITEGIELCLQGKSLKVYLEN